MPLAQAAFSFLSLPAESLFRAKAGRAQQNKAQALIR